MLENNLDVKIRKVDPAVGPIQDEDLDLYQEELKDITIVDVDVHMDDTLSNMRGYLEGHYRKRLETVLAADFKGEPGNSLRNMIAHVNWLGSTYGKPPQAQLATKEDLLERTNKGIIDYSILFPSELLPVAYLPDPRWAKALVTAYNQYMVDEFGGIPGIKIAILIAPQDPQHAVEEIARHAGHEDVVSVCIPDVGINPPIGAEKYWPIYEAAEHYRLPITFHGIEALVHDNYPLRVAHFQSLMEVHTMGFPFTSMLQVMDVVLQGVPMRYPSLKFCVLESGITFMPFIMYRLDTAYRQFRTEVPVLDRKPSEYIREWYVGTHELEALPRKGDLERFIQIYQGENTTMWASDWPHLDRDLLAGFMQYDMDPELRRKILGGNAMTFFGLEPRKQRRHEG